MGVGEMEVGEPKQTIARIPLLANETTKIYVVETSIYAWCACTEKSVNRIFLKKAGLDVYTKLVTQCAGGPVFNIFIYTTVLSAVGY